MVELMAELNVIAAVVAAVGAPGVTFWVMKRMTKNFMAQSAKHCQVCKAEINRRLANHDEKDKELAGKQAQLREKDLPKIRENYCKKSDLDQATGEIKEGIRQLGQEVKEQMKQTSDKVSSDVRQVHARIDEYINGKK